MQVKFAHLRDQGIDFLVFDADASSRSNADRDTLLQQLTQRANLAGLRGSKVALAFTQAGQLSFYGAPDLVRYLSANPFVIQWTHTLDA